VKYRVKGVYKWKEIVSYRKEIDVVVESDNPGVAIDDFIDGFDDWGDGEYYDDDTSYLDVEPLKDEDPEAMERDDQYRIMQALGVPTLFEVEP